LLLALDVGNTNITIGLFQDSKLVGDWRLSTNQHVTSDELGLQIDSLLHASGINGGDADQVVVSSVVPYLNRPLSDGLKRYLGVRPFFLSAEENGVLGLEVDEPSAVGTDRIANCIAAWYKYGGPTLIIDFGTATSYDLLSEEGNFLGGAIGPEMEIALETLYHKAALLPEVELQTPDSVIGKTTAQNMNSGFLLGFICMIEGMIELFKEEYSTDLEVIATGGKGRIFCEEMDAIDLYDEYLVLEGLRHWWQLTRK